MPAGDRSPNALPPAWALTAIGPGLLVAAAGIGAGDIVSATMAASRHGLALLWVVVLAACLKAVLNEGIARWQLATGTTAVEGWCTHLPRWLRWYFLVYLVLWTVSVSAALTSACGLGAATLTGNLVPRPWGAITHAIAGGALVAAGGFAGFEKVMKVLIGTMFFAILACAALTLRDPGAVVRGLVVPSVPAGDTASVLSVLGGIGGSVAMLAYSYWMREQQMAGSRWLAFVRRDVATAYLFTAVFGAAVMVVSTQAFHVPGVAITNAQAVTRMADTLSDTIGPVGFYAYAIGFWAAVFASLLGVWQSLPYLFADYYGLLRGHPRAVRDQTHHGDQPPVSAGAALRHDRAAAVCLRRPAAVHHPHLHHRRQPVHPLPGGHAPLPEQREDSRRERRAPELRRDQRRPGAGPGAVRRRRGVGSRPAAVVTARHRRRRSAACSEGWTRIRR